MANTYKSQSYNLSSSGTTTVLTASTTTLVNSLYFGNVSSGSSASISVILQKSGSTDVYLIKSALVPIQSTLQPITEPLVLENGDKLKVIPNTSNILDVILSYLEITWTSFFFRPTDGGVTWTAYNNSDRSNSNTYIRYTPASIADNIKVKFLLTEL